MFAIPAIYDGKVFHAQEAIPVRQEYDVVITFVKPREARQTGKHNTKERLEIVESFFGILPSTVTDGEIREERLKRYAGACGYQHHHGRGDDAIVSVTKRDGLEAFDTGMRDYEDSLLAVCARNWNADCIVTRNVSDFANSPVRAITPDDFLNELK